jgi:cystathionine beta-lyase family protein involved in aluminum resistance
MSVEFEERELDSQKPSAAFIGFLLGVFTIAIAAGTGIALYDVWFNSFGIFKTVGMMLPANPDAVRDIRVLTMSGLGATMGACLMNLLGLYKHAVLRRDFGLEFVGSYLLGPFAVILLGFAVFVLVRAGLFAFGGVSDLSAISPANEVSFMALGILTGYSWDHVLLKIQRIAKEMFATNGDQ